MLTEKRIIEKPMEDRAQSLTLSLDVFCIGLSPAPASKSSNTSSIIRNKRSLNVHSTACRFGEAYFRDEDTFFDDLTTVVASAGVSQVKVIESAYMS